MRRQAESNLRSAVVAGGATETLTGAIERAGYAVPHESTDLRIEGMQLDKLNDHITPTLAARREPMCAEGSGRQAKRGRSSASRRLTTR